MKTIKLQKEIKALQTRLEKMLNGVIRCTAKMCADVARHLDKLEERLQVLLNPVPALAVAGVQYQMSVFDVPSMTKEAKIEQLFSKALAKLVDYAKSEFGLNQEYSEKLEKIFSDKFSKRFIIRPQVINPNQRKSIIERSYFFINQDSEHEMIVQIYNILVKELETNIEEYDRLLSGEETEKNISEPDLEEAYQVADSLQFEGSEKQIKWARDIAIKETLEIALALKANKTIPTSAKWWIENRNNIQIK